MVRSAALDVHVHVHGNGSDWEQRHRVFRDWLRTHPNDRELYARAKEASAHQDWPDMNAYADAKTEVIALIMTRASHTLS